MCATAATSVETVVLGFVPRESFERIRAALPGCLLRFAARRHEVEIPALIHDVPWSSYEAILDEFPDRRFRHTYDDGTLEILMSPLKLHDRIKTLLGRLIEAMCLELGIRIQSVGSMTLHHRPLRKGLEPDESYYIANEPLVRNKDTYDPELDPPPDLTIEVDVTSKSIKRMPIYAALKVAKIWRWDGDGLYFYRRKRSGDYVQIKRSVAFPFITPADVMRHLDMLGSTDENSVVRAFVDWAKKAHKQSSH